MRISSFHCLDLCGLATQRSFEDLIRERFLTFSGQTSSYKVPNTCFWFQTLGAVYWVIGLVQNISSIIWYYFSYYFNTGWWFGTFGLFFHILGTIIPFDELIFFSGVGLNHQPEYLWRIGLGSFGYESWLKLRCSTMSCFFPCQGQLLTTSAMEMNQQSLTTDCGDNGQCVKMGILTPKVASFIGTMIFCLFTNGFWGTRTSFSGKKTLCFSEMWWDVDVNIAS